MAATNIYLLDISGISGKRTINGVNVCVVASDSSANAIIAANAAVSGDDTWSDAVVTTLTNADATVLLMAQAGPQ